MFLCSSVTYKRYMFVQFQFVYNIIIVAKLIIILETIGLQHKKNCHSVLIHVFVELIPVSFIC